MNRILPCALLIVITSSAAASQQVRETDIRPLPPQPWLGMTMCPLLDSAGKRFLHVKEVVGGGPAERAGVRPGDVVVRLGGASVSYGDDLDLLAFFATRRPGERLGVRVVREGKEIDLLIVVGTMPKNARHAWRETVRAVRARRVATRQTKE